MSKKTLNTANLEKLGAEKLAALVMELVQGSAALQRRARMELSAAQGPKDVAADLRKRFASLRRATSYVDWRKQRALVKDLDAQLTMIETNIAPEDADEAFELLWAFLQLAPFIHARTDDSNGAIGDVMRRAMALIDAIAPRLSLAPTTLAERILDAVVQAGYGEFDGIIPATQGTLGQTGLEHLKQITRDWAEAPPTEQEVQRYRRYGFSTAPELSAQRARQSTSAIILSEIADAQGDVDAYMAGYSAEQLTYATIAPNVARRLLDADRSKEAFSILTRAMAANADTSFRVVSPDLDDVYEDCLEKLGKLDALKTHLWTRFEQVLCPRSLRKYLKLLPDFDDIEAEDTALDHVAHFPHLGAAISFLVDWPALERAAKTVITRADALDGNAYTTLTHAADTLEARHPLAATLIRRAMIQDTLDGAKSKRYRHAARHLAECAACDLRIEDYGAFSSHSAFVAALRAQHGRKYGFWEMTDA